MNLGDVRIENGAEELYGSTNNFVFDDIKAAYGNSAQTKIFQESPSQDTMIVMDADGLGGGSTCWAETGDCDQDTDIYDSGNPAHTAMRDQLITYHQALQAQAQCAMVAGTGQRHRDQSGKMDTARPLRQLVM